MSPPRAQPIAIRHAGLVTSLGLTTATTCAALRASLSNPTPTRFMGVDGEWIMAHQVALPNPSTGLQRLAEMAALAVIECLEPLPAASRQGIPLLLCVAEPDRPGRVEGLDDGLFDELQKVLGLSFHPQHSSRAALGRPGVLAALVHARRLLQEEGAAYVLIVGVDSLLNWTTLTTYGDRSRLLAEHNSNGFMPGEAAGAVLVSLPAGGTELLCTGIGLAVEPAPLGSGAPLRADGLRAAIRVVLDETGCELHELDFRITDLSGEHYYFKEAALALARSMRQTKPEFDLWHPAEGIGEVGAAIAPVMLAQALTACQKRYSKGPGILLHSGADEGRRVAAALRWTGERR